MNGALNVFVRDLKSYLMKKAFFGMDEFFKNDFSVISIFCLLWFRISSKNFALIWEFIIISYLFMLFWGMPV